MGERREWRTIGRQRGKEEDKEGKKRNNENKKQKFLYFLSSLCIINSPTKTAKTCQYSLHLDYLFLLWICLIKASIFLFRHDPVSD